MVHKDTCVDFRGHDRPNRPPMRLSSYDATALAMIKPRRHQRPADLLLLMSYTL